MDFDKIVQKMRKKWQKLWSLADIEEYRELDAGVVKKGGAYKLIHRLVSTGVLISIRKGMYLWNMGEKLDPEDFYWPILKKVIAENYLGQGIIIWEKALAFGLRDYSLPETISVAVPKDAAKLALLGEYRLVSQDVRTGKRSLYPLIKKYASRIEVGGVQVMVTAPEHALLEALTTRTGVDINDTALIERWLKKNASSLREDVFAEFIPHKYISATNRLKYLAADVEIRPLYEMMVRLIDNQGKGCHLSRDFLLWRKYPRSRLKK
jgi:predicted transcriptional regulator of viral defense system